GLSRPGHRVSDPAAGRSGPLRTIGPAADQRRASRLARLLPPHSGHGRLLRLRQQPHRNRSVRLSGRAPGGRRVFSEAELSVPSLGVRFRLSGVRTSGGVPDPIPLRVGRKPTCPRCRAAFGGRIFADQARRLAGHPRSSNRRTNLMLRIPLPAFAIAAFASPLLAQAPSPGPAESVVVVPVSNTANVIPAAARVFSGRANQIGAVPTRVAEPGPIKI